MDDVKGIILIVDDEELIRDILCRKLQAEGYYCVTALDGQDALKKAFMQDFDIALLDIKMPGVSGIDLLSKIIVHHPDTCVVMATAVADAATAVEAMKLGAYDYVTKPFDMPDLVMRINRALERRKSVLESKEYQRNLEQKVKQQAAQIEEDSRQAIKKPAREQIALEKSDAVPKVQQAEVTNSSGDGNTSGEPSSPVREFGRKLSRLFSTATPLPQNGKHSAAPRETDKKTG